MRTQRNMLVVAVIFCLIAVVVASVQTVRLNSGSTAEVVDTQKIQQDAQYALGNSTKLCKDAGLVDLACAEYLNAYDPAQDVVSEDSDALSPAMVQLITKAEANPFCKDNSLTGIGCLEALATQEISWGGLGGGNTYPTHTVSVGENLTVIASQYSTTVDDLKAANGLVSDEIFVGQSLIIPVTDTDPTCFSFEECGGFTGTLHPQGLTWQAKNEDVCVLGTPSGTALPGIPGIDFANCFGFDQFPADTGSVQFSVDWVYTDQDIAEKMYDWAGIGERFAGVAWWGPQEGAYAMVSYNGGTPTMCHSFEIVANMPIKATFVNESNVTSAVWGLARVENENLPECMAPVQ